jgi:hypothetical protein
MLTSRAPHGVDLVPTLESGSPSVFGVRDIACPTDRTPPIHDDVNCQALYARFDLAATSEDPQAVQAAYADATDNAVEDGKLQETWKRTAPTSPLIVFGKAPNEED